MLSIRDRKLENENWEAHVGTDISGDPTNARVPIIYGTRWAKSALEFHITGGSYAQWLAAIHGTIPPQCPGRFSLAFQLKIDADCYDLAQALEFDVKLAQAGKLYNYSSQFNFQTGNFQFSGPAPWRNTGLRFGKFFPDQWYSVQYDYSFDFKKQFYSFLKLRVGEQIFQPPAAFQLMPASDTTWGDSWSLQVQQDLSAKGGAFSQYMRKVKLIWA